MVSRRGKRGRQRTTQRNQVPVINLDGASSSDNDREEEQQDTCVRQRGRTSRNTARRGRPPSSSARRARHSSSPSLKGMKYRTKEDLHITLSPDKMCRGIMSDSSDSEDSAAKRKCVVTPEPRVPSLLDAASSDTSDDIFEVNYSAHNEQALKGAIKELATTETIVMPSQQSIQSSTNSEPSTKKPSESDDDCLIEEPPEPQQKNKEDDIATPPSPTLFQIKKLIRRKEWNQRIIKQKDTAIARSVQQLEEFSKMQEEDSSINLSADIDFSEGEDEEEVNPEILLRIKWGQEHFRLPIRRLQKFSHIYEELAQRYGVSADRVVLSLRDKVINPALCPGDLDVTIVDLIEGGIQSEGSCSTRQHTAPAMAPALPIHPDAVTLKIQNSQRKGAVILSLAPHDKMSLLMHKYAEEKNLNINRLKFMFDGEPLDPKSTPANLDLEGGECIDVFEVP